MYPQTTSLKLVQLQSFHQPDGIEDGLFFGLVAVFIDVNDIARAVGDTHRTVQAAAVAGHAFEEVFSGYDIGDFAAVNAVYAEYFKEPYPARSCVEVAALPKGAKCECECIARR